MAISLPSEYQQVDWIASTGTQYIQLNISFDSTDKIETKFSMDMSSGADKYMVAPQTWNTADNRFAMGVSTSSNGVVYTCGYGSAITDDTHLSPLSNNDGQLHSWKYENNIFSITDLGISKDCSNITWGFMTTTLRLFYGYNSCSSGKIAYYKHYKILSGKPTLQLVLNLIPCYRKSDNVIGMYDTVNDTFYTNAGTGTFIKGPNTIQYSNFKICCGMKEEDRVKVGIINKNPGSSYWSYTHSPTTGYNYGCNIYYIKETIRDATVNNFSISFGNNKNCYITTSELGYTVEFTFNTPALLTPRQLSNISIYAQYTYTVTKKIGESWNHLNKDIVNEIIPFSWQSNGYPDLWSTFTKANVTITDHGAGYSPARYEYSVSKPYINNIKSIDSYSIELSDRSSFVFFVTPVCIINSGSLINSIILSGFTETNISSSYGGIRFSVTGKMKKLALPPLSIIDNCYPVYIKSDELND